MPWFVKVYYFVLRGFKNSPREILSPRSFCWSADGGGGRHPPQSFWLTEINLTQN